MYVTKITDTSSVFYISQHKRFTNLKKKCPKLYYGIKVN